MGIEAEKLPLRTEATGSPVASDLSWVERTDLKAKVQFIDGENDEGRVVGFVAVPMKRAHRILHHHVTWTCLTDPCYPSAIRADGLAEAVRVFTEHFRSEH